MKKVLAKIGKKVINYFSEVDNSVLFWNGIFLLVLIIVAIISFDAFLAVEGILCVFALLLIIGMTADNNYKELGKHLWLYFVPLTWTVLLFAGFILGLIWIYQNSIGRFNKFLDNGKKR